MIFTQKQAVDMWCPNARVVQTDSTSIDLVTSSRLMFTDSPTFNRAECNDVMMIPRGGSCLASRCAMWRWVDGTYMHVQAEDEDATSEAEAGARPEGDGWHFVPALDYELAYWSREREPGTRRGYCGIAGRPAWTIEDEE